MAKLANFYIKVVDANNIIVKNFPIQTSPSDKNTRSPDILTDEQGFVLLKASPNRDVDIWVLNIDGNFLKVKTVNSHNGWEKNESTDVIKLPALISKYIAVTPIKLFLDKDCTQPYLNSFFYYSSENKSETLVLCKDSTTTLKSLIGQPITITVLKPNHQDRLTPQVYIANRIRPAPLRISLKASNINNNHGTGEPDTQQPPSTDDLLITEDQIKRMFPRASSSDITAVVTEVNKNLKRFQLNDRIKQRHFFAQIKGEVGSDLKGKTEGWNYSPAALLSFSSYYRAHPAEAKTDGYLKSMENLFD